MTQPIQAGAEGLIWLIVGVFWVIAQIAGGAAKKKMPTQPLSDDEESGETPVDPFAELMRKLAGVQEFNIPAPPEPVELPEAAWDSDEIAALPDLSRRSETKADLQPLRREPLPPIIEISKIEEVDIRPMMQSFRSILPAMRLPSMRLSFQTLEKSGGKVPILGKTLNPDDRQSVRRAMLSHIIFSPPKALEKM